MARAQVDRKLRGQPFGIEDLEPSRQHVLVPVEVSDCEVRDCATDAGVVAVGLPVTTAGASLAFAERYLELPVGDG